MRRSLVPVLLALSVTACGTSDPAGVSSPASTSGRPSAATGSPGVKPSPWVPGVNHPTPAPAMGTWKETVLPGGGAEMNGVVAISPGDAWAVGNVGEGDPVVHLVRWNGRVWRSVTPPEGLFPARAVSASSGDGVWVFGDAGAWRRAGGGWSYMGGTRGSRPHLLEAAVVAGPRDVWIAGTTEGADATNPESRRPFLRRWSGTGWSDFSLPRGVEVRAFGAVGPRDVWALGRGPDDGAVIMRWDGDRWNTVPMPRSLAGRGVGLEDVAAFSADEAWAIGGDSATAVVIRWDGRRWNVVEGPARFVHFTAVAPDGHGGAWVAANYWDSTDKRMLLHYDGRSWTYERAPRTRNAPSVFDLALVPVSDQVIAVGGEPTFDEHSTAWIWTRQ
ncbi:hypothetical protein [Streptosporangium sp. NPDC048865]|uniref:hypothetical protein n=1 Tax=Streptosporangium sp. NPDC048865 TaxID=3155766 RepID=UPI003424AD15